MVICINDAMGFGSVLINFIGYGSRVPRINGGDVAYTIMEIAAYQNDIDKMNIYIYPLPASPHHILIEFRDTIQPLKGHVRNTSQLYWLKTKNQEQRVLTACIACNRFSSSVCSISSCVRAS